MPFQLIEAYVTCASPRLCSGIWPSLKLKLSKALRIRGSAQGRWRFCTTSLRTILNLPAGCGISISTEPLFLNISSRVLITAGSDLYVGLEGDMVPHSRGFYFSSDQPVQMSCLHPRRPHQSSLTTRPAFVNVVLLCNFASSLKIDRRFEQTLFGVRKQQNCSKMCLWFRQTFPRETSTKWDITTAPCWPSAVDIFTFPNCCGW